MAKTVKTKRGARIISKATVASYDAKLSAAVLRALSRQLDAVNTTLREAGLRGSLTAAGTKKKKKASAVAVGAIVVPFAWSQSNWNKLVNEELGPVASDVTAAAAAAAVAGLGFAAIAGAASGAEAMTALILSRAMAAGQAIGDRVDSAGIADDDVVAGIQAVFDTSGSILSNIIGAMGQATANGAELDQANAVISYGAPSYLSAQKQWNTQEDDKVRPSHDAADGQEVNINDTFSVGESDMTGPGDDSAPDDETINCRCFLTYNGMVPAGTEDQFENETAESGLANAAAGG